jgi:hypothetical protein
MNEIIITTSGLAEILTQIDELSEYDISVSEQSNGTVQITIGDSQYNINPAETIETPAEVVEDISTINDNVYDSFDEDSYIQSGVIKELTKTLLVGGLVRLASKILK